MFINQRKARQLDDTVIADVADWRAIINGDYWPVLGQVKCGELTNAQEGTADWFYARGVPGNLKGRFAEKAIERGFSTNSIDAISQKISDKLLGE